MNNHSNDDYDVIIIGSGFGGTMSAIPLINAGLKVLMIERGDWVPRGKFNWSEKGSVYFTPFYLKDEITFISPVSLNNRHKDLSIGLYSCVGGPSVFFGGVTLRFREADFQPGAEIVGNSQAEWAINYRELQPYYSTAESILNVAGEENTDPTEPPRNNSFPQQTPPLSKTSRLILKAARKLGLHPFRLPLAINYSPNERQQACVECTTCDTFACAVRAKNDLATRVLPDLIRKGLHLKANTVAVRFIRKDKNIAAVECFDVKQRRKIQFKGKLFILSAGSLATPQLLLNSELEKVNPGGRVIGHYLMRHCNAIVFGVFPNPPGRENRFHKQLGIHDFYFGHPSIKNPAGKLGSIQQIQTPPLPLVKSTLPGFLGNMISVILPHLTGLLVIAEDQPQYENFVTVDHNQRDEFGLPRILIQHQYSQRDLAARKALIQKAKQILRKAGALFFYVHKINTFSHTVGTVRMGKNPQTSALDEYCSFRGIDNLYVVDGSFMPTSAGLNPSLTISANALRVGGYIAKNFNRVTQWKTIVETG